MEAKTSQNLKFPEPGEKKGQRNRRKLLQKTFRCILYSRFPFIPLKDLKERLQAEQIASISEKDFSEGRKQQDKKKVLQRTLDIIFEKAVTKNAGCRQENLFQYPKDCERFRNEIRGKNLLSCQETGS